MEIKVGGFFGGRSRDLVTSNGLLCGGATLLGAGGDGWFKRFKEPSFMLQAELKGCL